MNPVDPSPTTDPALVALKVALGQRDTVRPGCPDAEGTLARLRAEGWRVSRLAEAQGEDEAAVAKRLEAAAEEEWLAPDRELPARAVQSPVGVCFACGQTLELVFPDLPYPQFENALHLDFGGGYGEFIDGPFHEAGPLSLIICHACAHALAEQVPWIERILDPAHSHTHLPGREHGPGNRGAS